MTHEGPLSAAEVRLACVGRLVPPVTHDISNPLATLLGRIQLHMVRGSAGMARGPGGLDDMYEQALIISDKVQTLGAWAREAAAADTPVVPAVLSDHVAEVTQLLGRFIARRGLELHIEIPPSIPPVRVRPLDLKLCVTGVLVALCAAARDPAPLLISADTFDGRVRLSVSVVGMAPSSISLPPEVHHLAAIASEDGLVLDAGEAFAITMPAGSPPAMGA